MGQRPHFEASMLVPQLEDIQRPKRICVAFSGGSDSTALLVALAAVRQALDPELEAIHADHGVHADSGRWADHCAAVCEHLAVPLHHTGPPTTTLPPGSPEERLRKWRYEQFEGVLTPGDVLCTAHHLDDQAETLLLALLRGSGPEGLAAMPQRRDLGQCTLLRPMLPFSRDQLVEWLKEQPMPWLDDPRALGRWIDDPANETLTPDRNYLRHQIMPRLRERWPASDRSIATSAELCAAASDRLSNAAGMALAGRCPAPGVLMLAGLQENPESLPIILRTWLKQRGTAPLPRARLAELTTQLVAARNDARIETAWAGHRLRFHRGRLWLDSPSASPDTVAASLTDIGALNLGPVTGRYALEPTRAIQGQAREASTRTKIASLPVRSRQRGDRIRPRVDGPSRPLKQWLSDTPVPPWLRDAIPVIPGDGELRAIGPTVLDSDLRETLAKARLALRWYPNDPGLAWAWNECSAALLELE